MSEINPQAPQPAPQGVKIPQANPSAPKGFWENLGTQIKSMFQLSTAKDMADQSSNTAKQLAQQLANKTGKAVNVPLNASDAVAMAQKTNPTPAPKPTPPVSATSAAASSPVIPVANAQTTPTPNTGAKTSGGTSASGGSNASGSATGAGNGSSSTGTATPPVTTGTPPSTPASAPPAGASVAETQAFYDANPMMLRPGESLDAYNARVSPLGGTTAPTKDNTDTTGGFISPSEQSKIADSMSSGMSAEDANSGGAALDAFNTASSASGTAPSGSLENEITDEMNSIMTDFSTPPSSLLTAYNNLLASSGITSDQLKLANLSAIMDGTADDIRAEITNNGGFATESQIDALTNARNANLNRQYNLLQSGLAVKQNYVDNQMKYAQADQEAASNNFEEKYTLIDNLQGTLAKLQSTDATAYYRFQTQQMSQLNTILKYGGKLSSDQIAAYSAATGIDTQTLMNAMSSADARYALTTKIDNSNLALKNMQISGGGITLSKITSLSVSGVPPTVSTSIAKQFAQGTSGADIQKSLEAQYGQTQGDSYFEAFNDVMGTKGNTGSAQSEIMTNIQAGATLQQLLSAYGPGTPTNMTESALQSLITNSAG